MQEHCAKHGPYSTFCRECDLETISTTQPSQAAREELKPCPFCGGTADWGYNMTMAFCKSCGATAFWKKWNTRFERDTEKRVRESVAGEAQSPQGEQVTEMMVERGWSAFVMAMGDIEKDVLLNEMTPDEERTVVRAILQAAMPAQDAGEANVERVAKALATTQGGPDWKAWANTVRLVLTALERTTDV